MAAHLGPAAGIGATGVPELVGAALPGFEPLFSPQQVAAYLGIDVSTCRRLFIDRPGVVRLGRPEARGDRRSYCPIRIPASVVEKFVSERSR